MTPKELAEYAVRLGISRESAVKTLGVIPELYDKALSEELKMVNAMYTKKEHEK